MARPRKPEADRTVVSRFTLYPDDLERLGALQEPGESLSACLRRIIEWTYILRVEQVEVPHDPLRRR